MVDIPRRDFHWHGFYWFESPVATVATGQVQLTCVWDNPTARTVRWGEGTSDEMCINYLYLTR